jgi:hypothetical protein
VEEMNGIDLAKQVWDDASALARAQIKLAQTVEAAPRVVYLLWSCIENDDGDVLLGVCGTLQRAKQEAEKLRLTVRIESRVVHS